MIRLRIPLLTLSAFIGVALAAQSVAAQNCSPAPSRYPQNSPAGLAIQGPNGCFPAADVNSARHRGYQLPATPPCSDCAAGGSSTAAEAANAVAACLEEAGYFSNSGTKDWKAGFTEALCKCNELVFGVPFSCSQFDASGGPDELEILDLLVKDRCIVIATLTVWNPIPGAPHIGSWGSHAVAVTGADPASGTVSVSDPNSPDAPTSFPIDTNGNVPTNVDPAKPNPPLAGGSVPTSVERYTVKCPESTPS